MKKVKVSGEVIIDDKLNNYEVDILIGDCPMEFINGNIRYRYLEETLKKTLNSAISAIRTFVVEEVKNDKTKASFYGKSIFEMSKKELRDLCCEFIYMNIDTNDNLQLLQNNVAIEFLKRAKGYKDIKETAFYITNQISNENYIDYEAMREKDVEKLFIVKEQHKPEFYTKPFIYKISKGNMLKKETEEENFNSLDLKELEK